MIQVQDEDQPFFGFRRRSECFWDLCNCQWLASSLIAGQWRLWNAWQHRMPLARWGLYLGYSSALVCAAMMLINFASLQFLNTQCQWTRTGPLDGVKRWSVFLRSIYASLCGYCYTALSWYMCWCIRCINKRKLSSGCILDVILLEFITSLSKPLRMFWSGVLDSKGGLQGWAVFWYDLIINFLLEPCSPAPTNLVGEEWFCGCITNTTISSSQPEQAAGLQIFQRKSNSLSRVSLSVTDPIWMGPL